MKLVFRADKKMLGRRSPIDLESGETSNLFAFNVNNFSALTACTDDLNALTAISIPKTNSKRDGETSVNFRPNIYCPKL